MNKLKMVAAALIAASMVFTVPQAARATEQASVSPSYANGIRHMTRDFSPNKVKRIITSTSMTLLATGEGFLDAICPIGGTLGKYSMAFDTVQIGPANLDPASAAAAISPQVYVGLGTGAGFTSAGGSDAYSNDNRRRCWVPLAPVKFTLGLYGGQNDAGHSTLYYIHCSDGSNPCSL